MHAGSRGGSPSLSCRAGGVLVTATARREFGGRHPQRSGFRKKWEQVREQRRPSPEPAFSAGASLCHVLNYPDGAEGSRRPRNPSPFVPTAVHSKCLSVLRPPIGHGRPESRRFERNSGLLLIYRRSGERGRGTFCGNETHGITAFETRKLYRVRGGSSDVTCGVTHLFPPLLFFSHGWLANCSPNADLVGPLAAVFPMQREINVFPDLPRGPERDRADPSARVCSAGPRAHAHTTTAPRHCASFTQTPLSEFHQI
ncbi:hypothetical protein AAFF_G00078910 [Aldrovandia affinis]|uniref:Uncharacterized protein n=1 Tax=Aldrovandia affinis TaxID=143900 RepID=A0AAD7WD13_9TELE|nr:hypothetical protein AAFF_G00078910 [Aldrovandia affinis]